MVMQRLPIHPEGHTLAATDHPAQFYVFDASDTMIGVLSRTGCNTWAFEDALLGPWFRGVAWPQLAAYLERRATADKSNLTAVAALWSKVQYRRRQLPESATVDSDAVIATETAATKVIAAVIAVLGYPCTYVAEP